jgi:hypothetical protein
VLVLVAGYAATASHFGNEGLTYAALTGVVVASSVVFLQRLKGPVASTLHLRLLFGILWFAYCVKFYWIVLAPDVGLDFIPRSLYVVNSASLLPSYETITCAMAAFCVSAAMLLRKSAGGGPAWVAGRVRAISGELWRRRVRRAGTLGSFLAIVGIVVTAYVMDRQGIGVMGLEGSRLPFRLAGIVFQVHTILIPALLTLAIWAGFETAEPKRVAFGLLLMLVLGLTDQYLRSSRGALAGLALWTLLVFLTSGRRLQKRHIIALGCVVLVVSLLYPLTTAYRDLRLRNPGVAAPRLVADVLVEQATGGPAGVRTAIATGIESFFFRVTGADLLVVFNGLGVEPLKLNAFESLIAPGGLSGYVTRDVFGVSYRDVNAVAPGLVGWFYLMYGNIGVVLGLAIFTLVTHMVWAGLSRTSFRSPPVVRALFLFFLATVAVDGALDSFVSLTTVAWPGSAAVCEWVLRR